MMPDREARSIVDTALALSRTHAHAPALDILDVAFEGHHGIDPNFDAPGKYFGDWTDPASPFGELLRKAFAANAIGADAAMLWVSDDPRDADRQVKLVNDWQFLVIDTFAARYRLWGSGT